jgi:precorrin-3B methylase
MRARQILLKARPTDTPVIVARNLDRPGERVEATTLGAFDPATADMLTLVLVGSSTTRTVAIGARQFVFTPRGYARKRRQ